MRASARLIVFLFLVLAVASCGPAEIKDPVMETAVAELWTKHAETQTAVSASTSWPNNMTVQALSTPTNISNLPIFTPGTPSPDRQVYTDPDGWYSVYFPADMKPMETPNSFRGPSGYLETGYLSKMGYMSNVLNVCAWIANIELEPEQSVVGWGEIFSPTYKIEPKCLVSAKDVKLNDSYWQNLKSEVFENPAADPEHRFVFIKTGWSYTNTTNCKMPAAFLAWLKPIAPRKEPILAPISDEEISVWKKTASLLEGATVTEYNLPDGSDPSQQMLWGDVPEEAHPDWSTRPQPTKTPKAEEQLKSLGYEFRVISESNPYRRQLLRDGRVLFDYVFRVSDVYHFSTNSDSITTFIVYTATLDQFHSLKEIRGFLIQNDAVYPWEYNHQDSPYPPILYQNEVLWLNAAKDFNHVKILKSNQEVVYSLAAFTEPIHQVNKFSSWENHWTLAARDFLIQDGEILNEKLGYEEIFNWSLVEDKPVYLFRKGPRIGLSYDGKILPLEYQDVARYWCCGLAVNNPDVDNNSVHFFGKRNGVWYYVEVKFK